MPESALYHYRRRAYNPEFGRFLQRDPIGYDDGMNVFAYTHNNPINYIDPDGEFAVPLVLGALAYFMFTNPDTANAPASKSSETYASTGVQGMTMDAAISIASATAGALAGKALQGMSKALSQLGKSLGPKLTSNAGANRISERYPKSI